MPAMALLRLQALECLLRQRGGGVEGQGTPVVLGGRRGIPEALQGQPAIVVGEAEAGIELHGAGEVGRGAPELLEVEIGVAAVVKDERVGRVERQRRGIVGEGVGYIAPCAYTLARLR